MANRFLNGVKGLFKKTSQTRFVAGMFTGALLAMGIFMGATVLIGLSALTFGTMPLTFLAVGATIIATAAVGAAVGATVAAATAPEGRKGFRQGWRQPEIDKAKYKLNQTGDFQIRLDNINTLREEAGAETLDVPSEYCDPILATIMDDPVQTKSCDYKQEMDRKVFEYYKISSIGIRGMHSGYEEECKPHTELKTDIENYLTAQEKIANELSGNKLPSSAHIIEILKTDDSPVATNPSLDQDFTTLPGMMITNDVSSNDEHTPIVPTTPTQRRLR